MEALGDASEQKGLECLLKDVQRLHKQPMDLLPLTMVLETQDLQDMQELQQRMSMHMSRMLSLQDL